MKYKKTKGKSKTITVNNEVRDSISAFKERLLQMAAQPDETSAFDANTVRLIFEELDEYDRNILIAFYSIANCNYAELGRLLGASGSTLRLRIQRITNKLIQLNDTEKSIFNCPRVGIDY